MHVLSVFIPLLFGCLIETCVAIKCMECTDVPHPGACNMVTTCSTNASCSLTEYITSSGARLFSSGCLSGQVCDRIHQIENSDTSEDASQDTVTCQECCYGGDYCNQQGCGKQLPKFGQRGSYCFECSVESGIYGCRTIRQCSQTQTCPPLDDNHRTSRGITVNLPFCCKSDFCNDVLQFVSNNNETVSVIHGGWSSWSEWSSCSRTCGDAGRTRNRTCDNPVSDNGLPCPGPDIETALCSPSNITCPADGLWSEWGPWTSCTKTCGHGYKTHRRRCDNPAPEPGGQRCPGASIQSIFCNFFHCPVNGSWSEWGQWSDCTRTCGHYGYKARSRVCDNPTPAPAHGSVHCPGSSKMLVLCNHFDCPGVTTKASSVWAEWGEWGRCHGDCGIGYKLRTRHCLAHSCIGGHVEKDSCMNSKCHDQRCQASEGFHIVTYDDTKLCLRVSNETEWWITARAECNKLGADLVSIGNYSENMALNFFLKHTRVPCKDCLNNQLDYIWMGLYIEKERYRWVNVRLPFSYFTWRGQPATHEAKPGLCGLGGNIQYGWLTQPCERDYQYVCQIDLN